MKKYLVVILLLIFQNVYTQDKVQTISIEFENTTRIEVVNQLEQKTNYHFFYMDDWFDDTLISGSFKNSTIRHILNNIFKNTVINYYISDDYNVILTSNNYIFNTLPEDFFTFKNDNLALENDSKPVLIENKSTQTQSNTIRIGKENKYSNQKSFVLSGYVRNIDSNEPIPNLVLLVPNKNINAVTDLKGYYSIELFPGENIVEFRSLGIQNVTKKIIIYNNGTFNFKLKENQELLEEVVIEADKDKNVGEAITGITQIEVKEIKTIPLVLGERDILKVATTLPGISSAGEGSSGFNVRGGKADQNLMLLDNAVIYNPTHFFGIFSALNPYTTGDLEIYKGSIPAKYGGRLSSVFDISTKSGNNKKFSGEGAIGPVTSNLTLEIPIINEKASLLIGGRGTYSDWILKTLDDPSLKNSEASFYDAVFKYNHKLNDNNTIEASGYYSKDKFSITSDSLYSYSNRLFSANWKHVFNKKNQGTLIFTNSEYQFNIGFDGTSNTDFDFGYSINETNLNYIMNYNYSDKHKFNYGISSKLYNNKPGNLNPDGFESIVEPISIPKERALESAIFIADNFKINDKLLVNIGLRYSFYAFLGETSQNIYAGGLPKSEGTVIDTLNYANNEVAKTYGGPEVRVSARYFLTSDFSIKASYNNTFQFIHTLSNNTTVSPTDIWKLSDVNIKPQKADQYSVGLYKNINGNNYELSLEGYYKTSENILDYKVGADLLLNKTIETEVLQGDGKAYGVEFLLRKNSGKLNGWLSYTYSRSLIKLDSEFDEERINNGEYFPSNYDKPNDFSMVLNYKFTKRYSFSANFIYQTGRPVTYPIGNYVYNGSEYVFYSNRNEYRIPDYYRLDLGINIEGNHKIKKLAHSFWNISVYNVLGRNNPYSVFFVTENGEIKAYQSSIFSVPIPTITYNFRF